MLIMYISELYHNFLDLFQVFIKYSLKLNHILPIIQQTLRLEGQQSTIILVCRRRNSSYDVGDA